MRRIRYLDKLVDEIAKGKAMDKILRRAPESTTAGARSSGALVPDS